MPQKVASVTDPVSQRSVTFAYSASAATGPCFGPVGKLCSISFWDGTSTTLTYNTAGQLIRVTNPGYVTPSGQTQLTLFDFAYDSAGRLKQVRDPLAADAIAYGTRSSGVRTNISYDSSVKVGTAGALVSCYDLADRLVSGPGITSATYDDHGNTLTLGSTSYSWDGADRQVGTSNGTANVTYTRDALDRIVTSTGPSGTTGYRYSGFGDTATLAVNGANQMVEQYVAMPGATSVTMPASTAEWRWATTDLHGDVMAVTSATGTLVGVRVTPDPYGNTPTADSNTTGTADAGYLGTSRRADHTVGLPVVIDMGARPYQADLGRFLTVDPIEGGCANDYTYTWGDPNNTNDITGKNWLGDAVGKAVHWVSKNRCPLLLAASITLGVAAAFATGGLATGLAAASIAAAIGAPASVGNWNGASQAAAEAVVFAGVGALVGDLLRVGTYGERAAENFLVKGAALGLAGSQGYSTFTGVKGTCS